MVPPLSRVVRVYLSRREHFNNKEKKTRTKPCCYEVGGGHSSQGPRPENAWHVQGQWDWASLECMKGKERDSWGRGGHRSNSRQGLTATVSLALL